MKRFSHPFQTPKRHTQDALCKICSILRKNVLQNTFLPEDQNLYFLDFENSEKIIVSRSIFLISELVNLENLAFLLIKNRENLAFLRTFRLLDCLKSIQRQILKMPTVKLCFGLKKSFMGRTDFTVAYPKILQNRNIFQQWI